MKKLVFAFGFLLILVILAFVFVVWRYPLAVFNWNNRRMLKNAGFQKTQVDTAAGKQTVWVAGTGDTLLLLHGLGDHGGSWSNIAPQLKSQYHVVVPDLAGHAESAPAEGPLSVGTVLAALSDIIDHESPGKPVILVGNSLGAWVAMLYAEKHPDRVTRLVLVDGGAVKGETPAYAHVPSSREDARKMFDAVIDAGSPRPSDFVLDDIVRQAQHGPMARMAQTAPEMQQYLMDDRLATFKTPVDLLWGESDRLMPLVYAQKLRNDLIAARLTTLPRCGHVPQQECPKAFGAALAQILGYPLPEPRPLAETPVEKSR